VKKKRKQEKGEEKRYQETNGGAGEDNVFTSFKRSSKKRSQNTERSGATRSKVEGFCRSCVGLVKSNDGTVGNWDERKI
jgi:hypothetical protein